MHGVLLVTGGARGIGAATVHLAAAQGYALR
jgi:NAD(P)-dependent dehydrogenase (short-subunit alcohol dehydrogenase family)